MTRQDFQQFFHKTTAQLGTDQIVFEESTYASAEDMPMGSCYPTLLAVTEMEGTVILGEEDNGFLFQVPIEDVDDEGYLDYLADEIRAYISEEPAAE